MTRLCEQQMHNRILQSQFYLNSVWPKTETIAAISEERSDTMKKTNR